jgi:hypothetical protein
VGDRTENIEIRDCESALATMVSSPLAQSDPLEELQAGHREFLIITDVVLDEPATGLLPGVPII